MRFLLSILSATGNPWGGRGTTLAVTSADSTVEIVWAGNDSTTSRATSPYVQVSTSSSSCDVFHALFPPQFYPGTSIKH